jgi:hypothetical protein
MLRIRDFSLSRDRVISSNMGREISRPGALRWVQIDSFDRKLCNSRKDFPGLFT